MGPVKHGFDIHMPQWHQRGYSNHLGWGSILEFAKNGWSCLHFREGPWSEQAFKNWTDYSAVIDGMKHTSIVSTTSTMRMNTRFFRATQPLRRFTTHRSGNERIAPRFVKADEFQRGRVLISKSFGSRYIFHSLSSPGKSQGTIYDGTLQWIQSRFTLLICTFGKHLFL